VITEEGARQRFATKWAISATRIQVTIIVSDFESLRLRPDVIILDISMDGISGIDIARKLRDSGCRAKIVLLTVHEDAGYMNAALGASGSAYAVKPRLSLDLLPATRAVLSNKLFVSASSMTESG
jgi:DNA-binding NarL/FixJ family response regulator